MVVQGDECRTVPRNVMRNVCVYYIIKSSLWELEDGSERFPEVHLFSISRAAFG
jgi:hypothetical protein